MVWLYGGAATINDRTGIVKCGRCYAGEVKVRTDENPRVGLAVARGMAAYGDVEAVRRTMDVAQTMINFTADQLDDLRTQCSTTAELTQQEIRMLEVRGPSESGRTSRAKIRTVLARRRWSSRPGASLSLSISLLSLSSTSCNCAVPASFRALRTSGLRHIGGNAEKYRLCRASRSGSVSCLHLFTLLLRMPSCRFPQFVNEKFVMSLR